jgi:hypothetical protein
MSAFPPKADIRPRDQNVCFGPKGDIQIFLPALTQALKADRFAHQESAKYKLAYLHLYPPTAVTPLLVFFVWDLVSNRSVLSSNARRATSFGPQPPA